MKIYLSPVRSDETIRVEREGDVLKVNDQVFDFSSLPEGATLPREAISSPWFAGPVERIGGDLRLTLKLPHGPAPSASEAFPKPITVTSNGLIQLPTDEVTQ